MLNGLRLATSVAHCSSVPAVFIAYLEAYVRFREHGRTSIDTVDTLVWQQVLCGYSLVSATTPCLKGFLGRFRTEDLVRVGQSTTTNSATYDHHSKTKPHPQSYALESLDSNAHRRRALNEESTTLDCRSAEVLHSATAYAEASGDNSGGSEKSFGSEEMIIRRKVEYGVTSS